MIKDIFVDIYQKFGVPGIVAYIAGVLMLSELPKQNDISDKILYVATGLLLLTLATFISNSRIKAQMMREKSLIDSVQTICENLSKEISGSPKDKTDAILQKIRQLHSNLINKIYDNQNENTKEDLNL